MKRRRVHQRRTHRKSKSIRGGSFKHVLGSIGRTLLNIAPIALSALGRKKRRSHRRGRGALVGQLPLPLA